MLFTFSLLCLKTSLFISAIQYIDINEGELLSFYLLPAYLIISLFHFKNYSKFWEAPCLDIIIRRGAVQNSFVADGLPSSWRCPLFLSFYTRSRCPISIFFSLSILTNFLLFILRGNLVFYRRGICPIWWIRDEALFCIYVKELSIKCYVFLNAIFIEISEIK